MTNRLTRLTLIRHADTDESDGNRSNPGLSDLGAWQAKRLRNRLETTGELREARQVLTSDLARSRETALEIASVVGETGLDPTVEPMLREMFWGEAEGLRWDELTATYGEPQDKKEAFAPGGESWSEFEERARSTLRRCADDFSGFSAVLVCHTGIIEMSFLEYGGLGSRSTRLGVTPRNAAITTWLGLGSSAGNTWRLERYNDCSHLWRDGQLQHRPEPLDAFSATGEPFWTALEQN